MVVDNLTCELPKDAGEGFGGIFLDDVIPAFFNGDNDRVLERGRMTTAEGELIIRYSYLQNYAEGEE